MESQHGIHVWRWSARAEKNQQRIMYVSMFWTYRRVTSSRKLFGLSFINRYYICRWISKQIHLSPSRSLVNHKNHNVLCQRNTHIIRISNHSHGFAANFKCQDYMLICFVFSGEWTATKDIDTWVNGVIPVIGVCSRQHGIYTCTREQISCFNCGHKIINQQKLRRGTLEVFLSSNFLWSIS